MGSVRLVERVNFSSGKVDRSGSYPVVRGVVLCGRRSKNSRTYKPSAFAEGRVKKYIGKPIHVDHGDPRKSRSYADKIGWVENAYLGKGGMPVGDIALNPSHPLAASVLWDIENRPDSGAGMSHVAVCSTQRGADGSEEVTELQEVEAVDIVLSPATVSSFFSESARNAAVPTEGHLFAESVNAPHENYTGHVPTDGAAFAASIRN